MRTKNGLRIVNVLVAVLFLIGNVLLGATPVSSQTGAAAATATPSDETPAIGEQITVTIDIDVTGVDAPDNALGAYSGTLSWNPAVLAYDSHSGAPPTGFSGSVNTDNAGTGTLAFNGANASGATGNTVAIEVTFDVVGGGSAGLNLAISEIAAAGTFANLASILTVNQGSVTVSGGTVSGSVELDGAVSSNTANTVSSISFAHTSGTGENRLMLVGVSWNAGTTARSIQSVTFSYDTTVLNLEEVRTEQAGTNLRWASIWSLADVPDAGQAGTVTVTFDGSVSNGIVAGAANFAGVDPSDPLGPTNGANGSSTAPSVTLAGLAGDELVFDTVFQGAADSGQTLTAGAGQTGLWHDFVGNTRAAASTEEATGDSVTMSWTAASSSIWAIVAVALNPAPAGTTYDLTVAVDPSASGTTTPSVGVHSYAEGSVVDITATPADGYAFDEWSSDCSGSGACQVTMDADKSVTAHFGEAPPSALAYVGDIGSATSNASSGTLVINTTADVAAGHGIIIAFATYGDPDYAVSVSDDAGNSYEQAATATTYEHGRTYIFAAYNVNPLTAGSNITITHTAVEGGTAAVASVFSGLASVDPLDQSLGNPVAGAQQTASGTTPTVGPTGTTAQADELLIGSIGTEGPPTDAAGTWDYGFTAGQRVGSSGAPNADWTVSMGWRIVSAVGQYTAQKTGITNTYWAAAIATFRGGVPAATHDLTVAVDPIGGGTTTPAAGVHTYVEGSVVDITATPADGYVFDEWSGDCSGSGACQVTMDGDKSVTAHFSQITHNLAVAVDPIGGGTTTPSAGVHSYAEGSVVDITATPAPGYILSHWSGDCSGSGACQVTMDGDKSVTAHFGQSPYAMYIPFLGRDW